LQIYYPVFAVVDAVSSRTEKERIKTHTAAGRSKRDYR